MIMKKLASLTLSATLIVNFSALNTSALPPMNKGVKKVLKGAAILTVATLGGIGAYYSGRTVLDLLYPERKVDRENLKKATKELSEIDNKLYSIETTQKDEIDRLNLRRSICLNIINKKTSKGLDTLKTISGIGGAIGCAGIALDALDVMGNVSKKIMNISCLRYANEHLKILGKNIKDVFETTPQEFSKDEVFNNFSTVFQGIEGQDEAIKSVNNFLYDIVIAKNQARWKNEKYTHGDVLYLHGPSGVGKSSIANKIPYALYSNPKVYTLTASDVDKDRKDSVVSQLFGEKPAMANPFGWGQQAEKPNNLSNFIKSNPNGIIKIEEYDKICTPALDEVLRTIMECGVINIDGERIDCSGMLFILTSNEDKVSLEGFDKSDDEKLDKNSMDQGYTRVWHDKSFLNRIRKVEFKNLNASAYASILRSHLNLLFEYWKDSKNGGIKFIINDQTIDLLSKEIEKLKQGARPIDLKIIPAIQGEIGIKIKSAVNWDFYRNKTLKVSYDEKAHKFKIKDNI